MSILANQISTARTRVPRFAEAAVTRARLTVVPQRVVGRTQAARTPFAVLVITLLVAGVVGLLMFNTQMQQASFRATSLQERADALTARQQSLNLELDQLRDPQRLALAAKELGMVAPSQPAFLRLSDGRVLGTPAAATAADSVRLTPFPQKKPASINPPPIIVKLPATRTADSAAVSAAPGAASTEVGTADGRKKSRP